jgi:hypothetical protein
LEDALGFFLTQRGRAGGPRNPLFMVGAGHIGRGEPEPLLSWATKTADDIQILAVPKENLAASGGAVVDFDLGKGFLEEIRVYGDVPVPASGVARETGETAVRGADEAVEAAARGTWSVDYPEAELVPIEFFDDMPSWNRGAARAGDVERDVWSHRIKAEYADEIPSFENFDELVDDMAERGLDNPLLVDFNPDTGDVILAEGNHRLAAARELGWDVIPVRVYRSTSTAAGRGAPIEKLLPPSEKAPFGRHFDVFGEDLPQAISPSQVGMPTAGGVARETGEAVARTDAEARAVIKSLEENAAPAASGVVDKPMWHGSSQRFDTFSAGHGDERALFGLGVYTTDDMSVAAGYSRKKTRPQNRPLGGTPGSEPRERLIYNVVWRGENPPRVLDLEATMPDEVRGIARSVADSLDHPWVTDELPYVALDSELTVLDELVSIVDNPASTFEDFYRKLVRVFAESGQPSTEFVDILQKMSGDLVEAGVDAFRYTGGKRGKGRLHEAMVWLDSESVEIVQAGNIEGLLRNTGG